MARRLGSAMISKADSTLFIYFIMHILVKVYTGDPSLGILGDPDPTSGDSDRLADYFFAA